MTATRPQEATAGNRLLPWLPLFVAVLNSYGAVGWNYGFALYFLNYRHGFVKRGLVGELFSSAAFLSRGSLLAIEYLFLAAAFALTYFVFRTALFGQRNDRKLAVLLLSAPAVLPHIGWLFAQPDVTLFLLLLLSLLMFLRLPPLLATALSLPVCCIALLGHEAFSLMFYPLIVAVLLQLCRTRKLPWIAGILHVVVVMAVFIAILHFGKLSVSPAVILAEATARTNVGIQPQVYEVMASTLAQQRVLVHKLYTPYVLQVLALTLVLIIPYFVLLFVLLRRALKAAAAPVSQQGFTALLMLAPLLLCALGHDTTRWIGAVGIDISFLILFLFLADEEAGPVRTTLRAWAAGPCYLVWLGYCLVIGPMGATGLRSADNIVNAWIGQ
jgi:hypothetical protein